MNLKLTLEEIAKLCHEVNREFCRAIKDPIKPSWEDAPEDQRVSCLKGVEYHLDNENTSPADSHDKWLEHKRMAGWTYGETYNPVALRHPCMVPFDQLPDAQKAKDFIFRAIVKTIAGMAPVVKVGLDPNDALDRGRMHSLEADMKALVGDTKVDLDEPIVGDVDL